MENLLTFVLSACILVFFLIWKLWERSPYRYPPGPHGLPILGSLLRIVPSKAHQQYTELSKQYGEAFTVNMAGTKLVFFNSTELIREAFVDETFRDVFAGRPESFYVKYCDRGPSTAFITYSEVWRRQRHELMKLLKIFHSGEHSIENIICEQLEAAVEIIKEKRGEPFSINDVISPTLANIIAILIAGKRYDTDDPILQCCIRFEEVDCRLLTGYYISVLSAFPFLRHLPFGLGRLYKEHQDAFNLYLQYFFENPKKSFNPSQNRGFVDTLLSLQQDEPWLTDERIKGILRETISAGLATTRGTLNTFFLILLHQPEVGKAIQREIDQMIGDRPPRLSDKAAMHYTEAATLELLRYVSVLPLTVPHTTTCDVEFKGYYLPKDTMILPNQWAAHHDEAEWGDPWVYRPERFLDSKGELLPLNSKERSNFMAFGLGRRMCLGENFARARMFLIITTLLQRFDFLPCENEQPPSHDCRTFDVTITVQCPKYRLRAVPRTL